MSLTMWMSMLARTLLLPPLNLLLLIAAGFLLWRRPAPIGHIGQVMVALGVALLTLICMPAVADLMVRPLEQGYPVLSAEAARQAQAIVVLAAGSLDQAPEYEGRDQPDYVALARLRYAARLQHQTGLPVLVSGGNAREETPEQNKALAMAEALREDFRTPVRWIEGGSENTEENALRSAALLRADGVQRVLLVTDAMHMPRAMLAFAQAGLVPTAAPTAFFSLPRWRWPALLPSAEGLRRSWYASYEWLGLGWYRLRAGQAMRSPTP
ncbi:YdcF family protein [Herbaspirillum seropedicae]|nr:YdcF family protein [Herbaspirillum seropedicae]AKN66183.1 hypothetical protein ACP92_13705 [Herbaspirillum seropedicae]NQE30730.1 hypothetical protein [Herbaspirillum seropedicae]UMU22173.1 YdcF family protein [Herbaspirillum seropedicae]